MKKLIAVLLLVSLLLSAGSLSAFAAEETEPYYWVAETPDIDPEELPGTVAGLMGDTDNNNTVNVKDATAIQKHLADIANFEGVSLHLADVDLSGGINIKDATAIQKWVAGIELDYSYVSHALYEPNALDERLFGKWETTTDFGETLNELFLLLTAEDPLFAQYIEISSCPVKETYEFFDDYSYIVVTDKDMLSRAIETAKADLTKGMEGYLVATFKEMGYVLTIDEILTLMEYSSMEEYIDEFFPDDLISELETQAHGHYRTTSDEKLYLDEYSDTYYELYTIEGDTMTITGNNENLMPELYPMVFEKVK